MITELTFYVHNPGVTAVLKLKGKEVWRATAHARVNIQRMMGLAAAKRRYLESRRHR